MTTGLLHEDRFFDSDPAVRRAARALYEETRGLPLICPHGHVDPRVLAEDQPFGDPTELILRPDHYILRMLYARGVPLGQWLSGDPRRAWRLLAEHYYLFHGTPTAAWLDYELHHVFGVTRRLAAASAHAIYAEIGQQVGSCIAPARSGPRRWRHWSRRADRRSVTSRHSSRRSRRVDDSSRPPARRPRTLPSWSPPRPRSMRTRPTACFRQRAAVPPRRPTNGASRATC